MNTELKYGLTLIFAMLLLAFVGVFVDLRTGFYVGITKFPIGSYVFLLLSHVAFYYAYYLCIKEKRDKQFSGRLSWSQGIESGLKLSLMWALAVVLIVMSMWFGLYYEGTSLPLLEKMGMFMNSISVLSVIYRLSLVLFLAILSGLLPTFIVTFFLKRNSQRR